MKKRMLPRQCNNSAATTNRRSLLIAAIVTIVSVAAAAKPPKLPEVSSTLLKLHKIYTSHPPHDTSLYDTLWVSPRATNADIQKSYRKLSRQYHPDKQQQRQSKTPNNNNKRQCEQELERIRQAYEVLKDDATRLPYHKYGLQDLSTAVLLLTGYQSTNQIPTAAEKIELLQLMGYHKFNKNNDNDPKKTSISSLAPPPPLRPPRQSSSSLARPYHQKHSPPPSATTSAIASLSPGERQERRIQFLAATILERIRPLVEGTVTEATLAHAIWADCDRLKKQPLGAQIIRCVGRAYRHAGRRLLRQYSSNEHPQSHSHYYHPNRPRHNNHIPKNKLTLAVSEPLRETWHDAKHLWTAAVASGRVTLQEKWRLKALADMNNKQKQNDKAASIAYHNLDGEPPAMGWEEDGGDNYNYDNGDNDDDDDGDFMAMMMEDDHSSSGASGDEYGEHEDLQLTEAQKAEKVMIELLQVEALWKVHKIGIDRSVREACDAILSGQYFFFPSHQQSTLGHDSSIPAIDGWVSSPSPSTTRSRQPGAAQQVIDVQEGRLRAAKALILVGDAMVKCSKDGTSWMD